MVQRHLIGVKNLKWFGVGLLVVLAGCLSTDKSPPEQLIPNPAATVSMKWHSFDPKTVTIQQGQTVQWHNTTFISHTVTCDPEMAKKAGDVILPAGATAFDSGRIHKDYQYTFTVPGTYRYICIPHESMGMIGEVIVQPATKP